MTLKGLIALKAVAAHMNITKAAHALRISQPSISKHMKALEEDYRITLFVSHGKGIRFTEQGRAFLSDIEPVLKHIEIFEAKYSKKTKEGKAQPLRLGGSYGVSAILPSLIARFNKKYPQSQIILRTDGSSSLESMLKKGELELSVTSMMPRSDELIADQFIPVRRVAFAAKGYPTEQLKTLDSLALRKTPLIIRNYGTGTGATQEVQDRFEERIHDFNIIMRCDSAEALKTAVSKRLGIGVLYDVALADAHSRRVFKRVPIKGLNKSSFTYVVYHKHRPLSSDGQSFLKLMRDWRDARK